MPITVTFLELTDPADIRPPARPPQREYALEPVEDPETSRWFYEHVGANHSWIDRLSWSPEQWRERAEQGESWMADRRRRARRLLLAAAVDRPGRDRRLRPAAGVPRPRPGRSPAHRRAAPRVRAGRPRLAAHLHARQPPGPSELRGPGNADLQARTPRVAAAFGDSGGGGNCTHVRRCCLDASTSVPVGVSSRRPGRSIRGARRRRHTLLNCPPQIEGPTCGVSPLSEAGDPNAGDSGRLPQTTS